MILNMTYRYHVHIGTGTFNYVPLRIDDESTLKDAWEIVAEFPPPNCMELILDLVLRQSYYSSNCNIVVDSGVGPSTQPIFEHSHCASPLMTANPEMDEDARSCDDMNIEEDDDYCGSDGDTSEESSDDDVDDEGVDVHHVDDGMIRYTLNRVIADDGSLSCPPISNEYGNDDFFDEEAAGIDGAHVGVGEFAVPSSVFMELSSETMQPLHENAMIPSRSLWNEASEFEKGMRFMCKVDIQHAVKLYSIKGHRRFVVTHSTPNVWIVRCKKYLDGCTWRLRCSRRKSHGMFEISKYAGPHTCIYAKLSKDHAHLDSTVICREVENVVRRDSSISVPVLHQIITDKFSYDVHYKKVWLGKKKAIAKVFGDWEESYKMLSRWMAALQESNPGTRVEWRHGEPNANNEVVFKWIFWAFAPSIAIFRHCRPIIQIDGTFLYGKYKQKLLIATVVDSNSHVFPLAFAIVDEESQDSWGWFMACLQHH
ncbi:hypothetical protein Scep_030156 [Stephania cephalantha]|uniref:Transposase MuDR plant domain-containing protein n=1 Tax=Stephania cephalantha TaxID=152367 RepID=A0AAP0HIA6_9MAGN